MVNSEVYFISGCIENGDNEVERVPDADAQFWSLYRKLNDGTDEWVEDFETKERAEEYLRELLKEFQEKPSKTLAYNISGIKCDNPECSFRDDGARLEDYPEWLNRPCPLCGSNLLTQADLDATKALIAYAETVNELFANVPMTNVLKAKFRAHMDGSGKVRIEPLPEN